MFHMPMSSPMMTRMLGLPEVCAKCDVADERTPHDRKLEKRRRGKRHQHQFREYSFHEFIFSSPLSVCEKVL